jgi:hypothetical protein
LFLRKRRRSVPAITSPVKRKKGFTAGLAVVVVRKGRERKLSVVGLTVPPVVKRVVQNPVVERMHQRVVSDDAAPPAPRVKHISVGRVHHDGFNTLHRMSC